MLPISCTLGVSSIFNLNKRSHRNTFMWVGKGAICNKYPPRTCNCTIACFKYINVLFLLFFFVSSSTSWSSSTSLSSSASLYHILVTRLLLLPILLSLPQPPPPIIIIVIITTMSYIFITGNTCLQSNLSRDQLLYWFLLIIYRRCASLCWLHLDFVFIYLQLSIHRYSVHYKLGFVHTYLMVYYDFYYYIIRSFIFCSAHVCFACFTIGKV